ncbi:MAG: methionine adenosyltransferase domain-containing protein [Alphaproteobacteria bacterium]|nr:methionine adenosyltransferase domain-containing protein [Alphaproteobacteria bacterium]
MLKTAEFVSLGHPDKTADFISEYILDRTLEQDERVKYAVEVMVKDNTVILGGEVCSNIKLKNIEEYVKDAVRQIGYDERYHQIWGRNALDVSNLKVINLIGCQSCEILQGVENGGWGDQGVFAGYACQGEGLLPRELYLAKKLNNALYAKALKSDNLGLDIKTQITIDDQGKIKTAIVAIPMLKHEDLTFFVEKTLGSVADELIINGTGNYTCHSAVADCGITGRKLACDFYSTTCPVGGGSPWAKDASKADVSLNILARKLAVQNLHDNDEVFVYLSSCIGRSELPSATLKCIKNDKTTWKNLEGDFSPRAVIKNLGLNKPVFADLCRKGITAL